MLKTSNTNIYWRLTYVENSELDTPLCWVMRLWKQEEKEINAEMLIIPDSQLLEVGLRR